MGRKSKAAEFVGLEYPVMIAGRNVTVTDFIKNYIEDKLTKIEKFSLRITDIAVTLDVQKLSNRVDIVLKVNNTVIKSQGDSTDMYVSIDQAVDKLQTQLRKYHEKLRDHQKKHDHPEEMNVRVIGRRLNEEFLEDINSEIEEESIRRLQDKYRPHEIVKKETMALKILTEKEALIKMETSKAPVIFYKDQADMKLKIIYRRDDGNFAIVEPK